MMVVGHSPDAGGSAGLDSAPIVAPIVYAGGDGRPDGASVTGHEPAKGTGKGSRWNAVRHGCMAKELFPAKLQIEIDRCVAMLTERYRPTNAFEVAVIGKMGRLAAQLERTQQVQVTDLQRSMDRAILEWDADRSVYIDVLVEKLNHDPEVARALGRTKQGVDWLLRTWKCLQEVFEFTGRLTDDEQTLALNLLGIRPELQHDYRSIMAEGDPADLAELIKNEIDWLQERLDGSLLALDSALRSMVSAGMPLEEDADTKRLRKQEARLKLEYRRAKAELIECRADAAAAAAGPVAVPDPPPDPHRDPDPEPKPEPAPAPAPAPVVSSRRWIPDEELNPPPRPKTSNAAFNYLKQQSFREALEIPATETAPAKRMQVLIPFRGGDPPPQPAPEPEAEVELESDVESDPVILADPAAAPPRPSRAATASQRREKDRHRRRALEKKARKAARRRRQ